VSEENKAIVRRIIDEVWAKGKLEVIDELCSNDFVDHDFKAPLGPGKQGFKNLVMMFRNAMPDLSAKIDVLVSDGERVACRLTFGGTQDGPIFGFPPSHKFAPVPQLSMFHIVDGKVVEMWHNADALGWLHYLGHIPTPGPPPGMKPPPGFKPPPGR
jgi:steroid delta-isomerase-like uncharacterized protein